MAVQKGSTGHSCAVDVSEETQLGNTCTEKGKVIKGNEFWSCTAVVVVVIRWRTM